MELCPPTLRDVLRARRVVRRFLSPTPLINYPALDAALGCEAYVKHENHQPVGAFKVRGGLYLVSQLGEAERQRGVIAASTGNHGLSLAYAARAFGVPAVIGVPEGANAVKVQAIAALGAEVLVFGADFDEAREHVEELAAGRGYRYVHSGDEPALLAGVGTLALEVLEEQPEIEVFIVPVGGGSGAAAAAIVAKSIDPAITVIGVQAAGAPAAWHGWREGRSVTLPSVHTFAEGLATRTTFALPQRVMRELLDDFVLVSDDELRGAIRLYLERAHTLAEGAGAASLAAALKLRERLAGRRVALVLSGGNITVGQLRNALAAEHDAG
ncbi:MAG TPA: threonine/serine dehydratase [Dehalococcoidia bacterium]|nr:threonine/serine dehydratase [Dehalococcoidia bacterium]